MFSNPSRCISQTQLPPPKLRFAGELGFEPRYSGPKPDVLPLDDSPMTLDCAKFLRNGKCDSIATMNGKKKTSWGKEASWYSTHLAGEDTYHTQVLLPNILRVVEPHKGQTVLEIGCGEGFFAEAIAKEGSAVTGCDIAPELIALAQKKGGARYLVTPAQNLSVFNGMRFDVVLAVLTLQNMERLDVVMKEVARVLQPDGRFIFVLNHPVIRSPQTSSWGFDTAQKTQYRRLDAYLSERRVKIDMHPGKEKKSVTYSFHRSLQEYMKLLRGAGFVVTRLEEWISHRQSQPGPRAHAEDISRKEFPLFMMIEAELR